MKMTNRPHLGDVAILISVLLAGCSSAGLSPRETGRQNYSSFVYSMYDLPAATAGANGDDVARRPGRLVLPARVAVAQVGEVAPPNAFLDKLRDRPDLFARVEAISGLPGAFQLEPDPSEAGYCVVAPARPGCRTATVNGDVRRDLAAMQRMARDMGMDHLLVVGGTVDHSTHGNALSILDLTIVGAFVVPSKEITARATAAGAMIDLDSAKVVLTASADASKGGLAATATQDGAELDVLRKARDEVVNKLGDSLVAECHRRQVAGTS